jgi:polyferredoxin
VIAVLATRHDSGLAVIHDRNPLFVRLADGGIRNAYTVRLSNKIPEDRPFEIRIDGFTPDQVASASGTRADSGWPVFVVGPDQTLEERIFVTLPQSALRSGHDHDDDKRDISFRLMDVRSGAQVRVKDHFMMPKDERK